MPFSAADEALFGAARTVMTSAYAPYSGFPVGAAIRTGTGKVYVGCNVENVAFPQSSCAEASAISAMVSAGETQIAAIAVVAAKLPLITPCGGCRQRIAEFATAGTPVILGDLEGPRKAVTIGDLLPASFGKAALG